MTNKTPYLDAYTEDLTKKVKEYPAEHEVFGRDLEIEQVVTSLLRKTKNSALLIGEAGVGKTAIVEGLALKIARKQVSQKLAGVTVRSLELATLTNNADGTIIEKFKHIIDELVKTKGKNLLFIDEIHTLMGTGSTNGSALDAGNVLKPSLARGEIQLVGATTLDEYHETIENDRALQRRFQNIQIAEPTPLQAIEILTGAKEVFEKYHEVLITKSAVSQAVHLSVRYLPDYFLPDKAFDLLDEACTIASVTQQKKVTKRQIAEVLKRRTGIPVTTILKDENKRLERIEERLKKRVKGQDFAVKTVADVVTIAKAGLQDETKPLSTLLFLGTTGVGKTELAKGLAEVMFDDENAMIRLDMSEYSQPGSSLKLIGTKKSKGVLTEAVKHRPYSIVLFDELEKAEREVHDLLLQILDDGRLTDGTGRVVSFKNTIVIMTTNIGAERIKINTELKGNVEQLSLREYQQFIAAMELELQNEFRPEFINRIEHKIIFQMLEKDVIKQIAIKDLELLNKRMAKQGAYLVYDQKLVDYLADNGTDLNNGARPLARLIDRAILAPVARKLVKLTKEKDKLYEFRVKVMGRAPDQVEELVDQRKLEFDIRIINRI